MFCQSDKHNDVLTNWHFNRKYKGYRDFTSYMAADPDFFAVRRFGRLHTRALLTLQDQIVELEKRLDAMDQRFSLKTTKLSGFHNPVVVDTTVFEKRTNSTICASKELEPPETRDINNGTIRDDIPERAELVSQVIERLKEYGMSRWPGGPDSECELIC